MILVKKYIYIVIILVCFTSSCKRGIVPLEDSRKERIINSYLTCEECIDGELEALLSLGTKALPYLSEVIKYGAPPQVLSNAYTNYHNASLKIAAWQKLNNLKLANIDPAEVVQNLEYSYRLRAIEAVKEIGGRPGKNLLNRLKNRITNPQLLMVLNVELANFPSNSNNQINGNQNVINNN